MTQFSHDDRMILDAESRLWTVSDILRDVQAGSFQRRAQLVRESAETLAREIRTYNDQFEDCE